MLTSEISALKQVAAHIVPHYPIAQHIIHRQWDGSLGTTQQGKLWTVEELTVWLQAIQAEGLDLAALEFC
jgi:hypothetical protein